MRILYLYPYYGEVGWELFNWRSHARFVCQEQGPFDHRFAVVRAGHEGIYNGLIYEFDTFTEHEDCTEGNAFVLHRPDAYDHYKAHCQRCNKQVAKLRKHGHEVVPVRLPLSKYRYFRYKMRHRLFEILQPYPERLAHWQRQITPTALIFALRWINRSTKKNTPEHLYQAAADWADKCGRQFVTVGKRSHPMKFSQRGLALMDQTTLDDLIAIYHLGGMVIGSSSGPMHLASVTCTPHVVWGGGRNDVRARYLKEWNPFKTPVDYLTTKFTLDGKVLQRALLRMSDNPEADARRRERLESTA